MAQLSLADAINRFPANESRIDTFVNGDVEDSYLTPSGVEVPSIANFLAQKDSEISGVAEQVTALTQPSGSSLVGYSVAGGPTRTVQDRLRETLSVKDFGAVGDGIVDDTATIQAAIDQLPAGSSLHFSPGVYVVQGLKLSGTNSDRTGLTFIGKNATLQLPAGVSSKNTAELTGGTDYEIRGLTFRGNKGTVTTDHSDLSYRYHNGLYVGAISGKTLSNVRLSDVKFENCAYGGLMLGSGPVQPANIGPGVDHVVITNATFARNEFGMAGGAYRHVTMTGLDFIDNDIYGLVTDEGCTDISITGLTARTLSTMGGINAGVFLYSSDNVALSGLSLSGGKQGLLISTGCSNISVDGITVRGPTAHGVTVYNSTRVTLNGVSITGAGQYGLNIETNSSQISVCSPVITGCGYDGVILKSVSTVTITGGEYIGNNGSGILATGSTWCKIIGAIALNNSAGGDASASGIRLINSTRFAVIGVQAVDSAPLGSRKQNYGITEEGTSNANNFIGCDCTPNKNGDMNIIGNLSMVVANSPDNPDIKLPSGGVFVKGGTAAAPAYGFAADAASGIYRTGGGNVGFSVGGSLQALVQGQSGAVNYPVLRGSSTTNVVFFPEGAGTDLVLTLQGKGAAGGVCAGVSGGRIAFYGGTPVTKPTITGSRGGNVALASVASALATLGLAIDNTTA